jgi:hypothetical protein
MYQYPKHSRIIPRFLNRKGDSMRFLDDMIVWIATSIIRCVMAIGTAFVYLQFLVMALVVLGVFAGLLYGAKKLILGD